MIDFGVVSDTLIAMFDIVPVESFVVVLLIVFLISSTKRLFDGLIPNKPRRVRPKASGGFIPSLKYWIYRRFLVRYYPTIMYKEDFEE